MKILFLYAALVSVGLVFSSMELRETKKKHENLTQEYLLLDDEVQNLESENLNLKNKLVFFCGPKV